MTPGRQLLRLALLWARLRRCWGALGHDYRDAPTCHRPPVHCKPLGAWWSISDGPCSRRTCRGSCRAGSGGWRPGSLMTTRGSSAPCLRPIPGGHVFSAQARVDAHWRPSASEGRDEKRSKPRRGAPRTVADPLLPDIDVSAPLHAHHGHDLGNDETGQLGEDELDEIKELFSSHRLHVFFLTTAIGVVHSWLLSRLQERCRFLPRAHRAGLSSRTMVSNFICSLIIFLFVRLGLRLAAGFVTVGIETAIEFWKVWRVLRARAALRGGRREAAEATAAAAGGKLQRGGSIVAGSFIPRGRQHQAPQMAKLRWKGWHRARRGRRRRRRRRRRRQTNGKPLQKRRLKRTMP